MPLQRQHYSRSPEVLVVSLARTGDRSAFEELVRRRQTWIRNLMRRCCGNITLADDLAQQVFMQAWRTIHHLQRRDRFGAWLKRVAVNTWLQHVRKNDPLKDAEEHDETNLTQQDTTGVAMDLDSALATLPNPVRLCVVLSYHEGMTHSEIADITGMSPGTIKSHIRRGSERLRRLLSAYEDTAPAEDSE
ncbi:MAG: sigma-70 family RNA polymerase sigma factor [Gammaproteobacteria bacterium]|nr:sigma-70 family RNA polymerase sigma factor [Gammaproteobacteria bacterium]